MTTGYNVSANGIRHHLIHHPAKGQAGGPQMLLIPGITSPAITWGFIADRLSDRYDVHVLDVRGRGLSQAGDLDYSLDAMAADAVALVDALNLDKPIVLGHSMGARTAIRAARNSSDKFGGLLLIDPPVSGPGRREYPSALPWYVDSIEMATKGCTAEDMRAFCKTWTDDQLALRAEWLHTCQSDAIVTTFEGFHTDDIHQDLPHITTPMRLVRAGGATVILDEDVAEIEQLAPGIEVRTVPDAGHMIPWDNMEGFLDAVMDFGE